MSTMITLTNKELNIDDVSLVRLEDIPRLMLKHKREQVIKAYCDRFEFTVEELAKFEGGIGDWIGFGSVTCYELGGGTLVGYGYNELQMVVI